MEEINEMIRAEIPKQYGTVKNFAKACGIPYSTLTNALAKGFNGTAYYTVEKICRMLHIRQPCDGGLTLFEEGSDELYGKLEALDELGRHTVNTILTMAYERGAGE